MEVQIDEKTLQDIASTTNGKYFRASSNKALEAIYQEIDQLERSKIEVKEYHKKKEEFFIVALAAFVLLMIEFVLKHSIFRSITQC